MFEDRVSRNAYISTNAGETWEMVNRGKGTIVELQMHPFDNKRAYLITEAKEHWMTSDRGKTWTEFATGRLASMFRAAMTFHAGDPDRIIFNGMDCTGIFCDEIVGVQEAVY